MNSLETAPMKEVAAHIRARLKALKVPARVKMTDSCGTPGVAISMSKELFYGDRRWTPEQARTIASAARTAGLKHVRGAPIDLLVQEQLLGCDQFNFFRVN